jgi:hypothetical protein
VEAANDTRANEEAANDTSALYFGVPFDILFEVSTDTTGGTEIIKGNTAATLLHPNTATVGDATQTLWTTPWGVKMVPPPRAQQTSHPLQSLACVVNQVATARHKCEFFRLGRKVGSVDVPLNARLCDNKYIPQNKNDGPIVFKVWVPSHNRDAAAIGVAMAEKAACARSPETVFKVWVPSHNPDAAAIGVDIAGKAACARTLEPWEQSNDYSNDARREVDQALVRWPNCGGNELLYLHAFLSSWPR